MSKDKSKKWVISAPLFYNYAKIPKGILGLKIPPNPNQRMRSKKA
ncbi:hypothetical protein [Campylobacter sp.]|nr:hypothetical protein [Campylobacter sp.]